MGIRITCCLSFVSEHRISKIWFPVLSCLGTCQAVRLLYCRRFFSCVEYQGIDAISEMAVAAVPYFNLNGVNIGTGNLQLSDGAMITLMNKATRTYLQANTNGANYTIDSSNVGNAQKFKIVDPHNGNLALLGNNGFFLSGIYNGKSPFLIKDAASSVTADYTWMQVVPVGNGAFAFRNLSSGGSYMNVDGNTALFSGGGVVDSTTWIIMPAAVSVCALNANNMLTDYCQTNCTQDMTGCAGGFAAFCPNNVQADICKTYGKTNPAQQAIYDVWYSKYCAANSNNTDYCACSNASPAAQKAEAILTKAGIVTIPVCNRASCSTNANAWKTAQMQSTVCPQQQICYQSLDAVVSESEISNVSFSCTQKNSSTSGGTTNTSTTNASNNTTSSTTQPSTGSTASSSTSTGSDRDLIIGGSVAGGVILLSSCIALIIYLRSRKP